jgi:hypothetical protein
MAANIKTDTYLKAENVFLRFMTSMSVARLSIVIDLIAHIFGLYSSN